VLQQSPNPYFFVNKAMASDFFFRHWLFRLRSLTRTVSIWHIILRGHYHEEQKSLKGPYAHFFGPYFCVNGHHGRAGKRCETVFTRGKMHSNFTPVRGTVGHYFWLWGNDAMSHYRLLPVEFFLNALCSVV
jgi:hypothetical protein